ncbi:hypothetical protein BH10ACI4_BH10ACI4_20940 [soil metagenome]
MVAFSTSSIPDKAVPMSVNGQKQDKNAFPFR